MSKETNVELFLGVDHQFEFTILNAGETAAIDVATWTLSWMLKRRWSDADAAKLLQKTSGSGITITGTFNATPGTNTQRVVVTIADEDTDALAQGKRYYELKRTDAGFETILAYGALTLKKGVHSS